MPALRINDLTIEYLQGGYSVRPVDGMSAEASDGELVLLLGPSGSGKTTLLSCLAGLLTPTSGHIAVGETEVTTLQGRALADYRRRGVGVVFQARLRRTLEDIAALADLRPNVRICKGIYLEPESIAYTEFEEIRASYVLSLEALVETASFVGIATHDEFLISEGKRIARERYEFQMLLGVRESLGQELVRRGERLRIYVPFGRQWYEYSLRRLQENPRIAGYVATDTVGRLLSRNGGRS